MEAAVSRKKTLALPIMLAAIFLLAAGGCVFFLLDGTQVHQAVAQVDGLRYDDIKTEKGAQYALDGKAISAEITESKEDSVYHTPLGFSIVSHTDKWTGDKLVEVYNELLQNKHGVEMGYLSQIDLYPGAAEYADTFAAAGDQQRADLDTNVFADAPAIIPAKLRFNAAPVVSEISLYNMDKYDQASQFADTLAHEYGHHYTIYYFMQDDEAAKASQYYQLRGLANCPHEIFYDTMESYYENHMWDIYEMAAEDYVQLMGGPDTKQTITCMDNMDLVETGMAPSDVKTGYVQRNVHPQENIFIPLADETAGLADYYNAFIGAEIENAAPPQTADFGLQIEKKSNYGYRYYAVTWTMVNTDPAALYTLVCCDKDGAFFRAVRTVHGGEEPVARVGSIVARKGDWVRGWDDGIPDEDRIFKLYLLMPDGSMCASKPFEVDF